MPRATDRDEILDVTRYYGEFIFSVQIGIIRMGGMFMKQIIQPILETLERGESVVLCSILAASGSSPRGAGAKMVVFADGHTAGTVGGGPVEYAATQEAMEVLRSGETRLRAFSLSNAQVASIGMICGDLWFDCLESVVWTSNGCVGYNILPHSHLRRNYPAGGLNCAVHDIGDRGNA